MTPCLICYRLDSSMPYDSELIWAWVQRHEGLVSVRGDCVDFWIDPQYSSLLVLAWPLLRRRPDWDYV
jgi:hypothetical protein